MNVRDDPMQDGEGQSIDRAKREQNRRRLACLAMKCGNQLKGHLQAAQSA